MKIRNGFVTNSSSSSFILARMGELTEKQKDAILAYVIEHMMGEVFLSPDMPETEVKAKLDDWYCDGEQRDQILEALKRGQTVYFGRVDYEESDYQLSDLFRNLWKSIGDVSTGKEFCVIDGDLSY